MLLPDRPEMKKRQIWKTKLQHSFWISRVGSKNQFKYLSVTKHKWLENSQCWSNEDRSSLSAGCCLFHTSLRRVRLFSAVVRDHKCELISLIHMNTALTNIGNNFGFIFLHKWTHTCANTLGSKPHPYDWEMIDSSSESHTLSPVPSSSHFWSL